MTEAHFILDQFNGASTNSIYIMDGIVKRQFIQISLICHNNPVR